MMKTLFSLCGIALLCLGGSSISAQTFGLKGGLNVSNVYTSDDQDLYVTALGYYGGLQMEWEATDHWSFESGLYVSHKPMKAEFMLLGVNFEYLYNPYYIELPILAKGYLDLGENGMRLYGNLGPVLDIGVFGDYELKVSSDTETQEQSGDIEWGGSSDDQLRRFAYSLQAGLGLQIKAFEVGVAYQYGYSNSAPINDDDGKLKHRVLQANIAYRFGYKPPMEEAPEQE